MKVGIIGAGSIGLLFASYISRVFEVAIYTRTAKQAQEINKNGIILRKGEEEKVTMVKAQPFSLWQGTEDVTIIAVKQYQLPSIIEKINLLSVMPDHFLFLQNGMGHLKLLEEIGANHLYVGSIEHGALKENSYTVSHNGNGVTNVAVFKGDTITLQQFSSAFTREFPMSFQEDFYPMLEKKLIVNAVINPLTALLQVKNGVLIANPFYYQAVRNIFAEISFILNLEQSDEYLQLVIDICKNTADNRSSMLKDMEANRLTEVDAILGYLLDEARRQEKQAPQISNLYHFIKGNELEREEVL
ncbi:2-dehydropantoate 2-reductase [Neobacillus bataviensis LMG 21833]|uniref:2-dehydropantoate 2-reductase n=1 Tax=Neobacillus bataviensis LMG 21833 TaxID=1117379 RepID=K6DE37_9BACI|nr:2-dehydropantoate 2-reductase [Neobacillus bataviensis]EKN66328.1 2-dehydropantoate 2-reductase [Neobacillus bataviensis LMG 21833]